MCEANSYLPITERCALSHCVKEAEEKLKTKEEELTAKDEDLNAKDVELTAKDKRISQLKRKNKHFEELRKVCFLSGVYILYSCGEFVINFESITIIIIGLNTFV